MHSAPIYFVHLRGTLSFDFFDSAATCVVAQVSQDIATCLSSIWSRLWRWILILRFRIFSVTMHFALPKRRRIVSIAKPLVFCSKMHNPVFLVNYLVNFIVKNHQQSTQWNLLSNWPKKLDCAFLFGKMYKMHKNRHCPWYLALKYFTKTCNFIVRG